MKTSPEVAKMILFAYVTPNQAETAAWYKKALGIEFGGDPFKVDRLDIDAGQLSEGDAMVELLQMAPWRGVETGYASGHIGFQVKDIEIMRNHIISMGCKPSEILFPFEGSDKVKICYFLGPNEEKIELVQMDE